MKYIYYPFLAIAITITSCKNNNEEKTKAAGVIIPFTQQEATVLQAQTAQQPTPQNHNLFHENNPAGRPSVISGINPAHGQPNHRCDIPVGAPLNSQAQTVNGPQSNQVQMQPQTITQSAIAKTVTPKGMNPPHGEKNHRCDIAVGAPLNSKPTATAPTTPAAVSGEISKSITVQPPLPALLSTNSANIETADGMNPPHGQAGHRCDVAVGAALPKN